MDFYNSYAHGFARVAACATPTAIADPATNAATVIAQAQECHEKHVAVAIFPELTLSGYAIDDLLLQDPLLDAVEAALADIVAASNDLLPLLVIGAPLRHGNRLYNCAVVVHRGHILGVAPKSYLPNYREFYEKRHFAAGDLITGQTLTFGAGAPDRRTSIAGLQVPFGTDLLFSASDLPGLVLHVEVCEDMWVPVPPSSVAALAGATVMANISGSPITVGRADDRHLLSQAQSARCLSAYLYAAAGQGESTTDLSWDGMTMVYECGGLLGQTERFPEGPVATIVDIDLDRIRQDRLRDGSIDDNARTYADWSGTFRTIDFEVAPPAGDLGLLRQIDRFPFVPDDPARMAQDCYEAYNIQVSGLMQRLRAIGQPKVVIGVSGGLDSTHALIVAARAMDKLGRPRSDILAFTMPGFATGSTSKGFAHALGEGLGVTFEELDIKPAARQMLTDMGHPFAGGEPVYDVTFENVQAGLRTDFLFRIANQRGGIVLGTGDLSELALGWCTYGVGDQMSHYTVNSGIPKTLIQHLIRWVVTEKFFDEAVGQTLAGIVNAEISPELVPAGEDEKPQSTEDAIGPYALQDFNLYHVLRYGFRPSKIAFLAWHAWHDPALGDWPEGMPTDRRTGYDLETITHWLEVFIKRFFAFSQFKRSALPNGPKVVHGGSLSPRGDWRAPSDGNAAVWLAELHEAVPR
ncbi:NAD+ synthase (glutamine-hydrolysing) [Branchiibius hedensis]|uniref:Glutamine-dependent NAD(+) synthetase n=1 Tax=Branchiibius hedensis TaxID=672460 RepID=A0A2Y9C291_9MICO|nr:NAD(+) synthase [Branchiibius hedensis]PWJ26882.1 NAD+ synthase (glutamine-hydrolysing) [Branchiibius hedensis]SSA35693.1 NAD+ synthase (glutamine-hydrolysing) [Branchiibius hedensis]